MEHDTKLSILGSTASGVAGSKRIQSDIDEKGHSILVGRGETSEPVAAHV